MRWVVDASSAVAYLLGQGSEVERAAMVDDIHAPSLIDVEVTQTLRGLVRGAKIELSVAERAREELTQLGVRRHPDASLLPRAWELRDVCTTYDALYVALTQGLDAKLVTRDAPLANGIEKLINVVLSDQQSAPHDGPRPRRPRRPDRLPEAWRQHDHRN